PCEDGLAVEDAARALRLGGGAPRRPRGGQALEDLEEAPGVDRLGEETLPSPGNAAARGPRWGARPPGCDAQARGFPLAHARPSASHHLEPVEPGHLQVEQRDVETLLLQARERIASVADADDLVAALLQNAGDDGAVDGIVLRQENAQPRPLAQRVTRHEPAFGPLRDVDDGEGRLHEL